MVTKQISWTTGSGNITLTYEGQGNGTIAVESDANDLGSARSQTIIVQTTDGVVTQNLTVSQAACPFPVGEVRTYSYTGAVQEVALPAGKYKLQVWGAQGGSNAAASSYDITAKAGGKGGYSEGVITLSQPTTFKVYVGGKGSSSAGGFNGGGSTSGSSSYSSGDEYGVSRMGGGGGATDIRLSDGSLLSRMIVAGGGSGGAACYRSKTTSTTSWETVINETCQTTSWEEKYNGYRAYDSSYGGNSSYGVWSSSSSHSGEEYRISCTVVSGTLIQYQLEALTENWGNHITGTQLTITNQTRMFARCWAKEYGSQVNIVVEKKVSSSSTTTSTDSHVGYVGGGTSGGGYSSTYQGKQNAAGTGGDFGTGANQTTTNYRYCSGAGGGGWYGGGGGKYSDSSMTYCRYSGGGSGFVNTAANASYRPSGYTGLELDSGETKAGNTSFPNTAGTGNETGHSGNGYAKITRIS